VKKSDEKERMMDSDQLECLLIHVNTPYQRVSPYLRAFGALIERAVFGETSHHLDARYGRIMQKWYFPGEKDGEEVKLYH
jgi:hypothetical protein